MSIAIPFLAFLFVGAIAAYHRLRLPVWAALTATVLVGCYLLGANPTATVVAAVLVALIAVPLLIPQIRLIGNGACARCGMCRRRGDGGSLAQAYAGH